MRARARKRENGGCSYANREEAEMMMMMMMTGEGKKGRKIRGESWRIVVQETKADIIILRNVYE